MKKQMIAISMMALGFFLTSMTMPAAWETINSMFVWDSKVHDFGKIELNVPAEHTFRFTNNGDEPLIISSVKASCGCTVAEYTKEPIAPGESGEVLARYNAAKSGAFIKTVTVNANTGDDNVILTLKGEVISTKE